MIDMFYTAVESLVFLRFRVIYYAMLKEELV